MSEALRQALTYVNLGLIGAAHIGSLFVWRLDFSWMQCVLLTLLYVIPTLAFNAGYHRLWAHRSYRATSSLQSALAIAGCGALQGSILSWCRMHRRHHHFVGTKDDPLRCDETKGFAHLHFAAVLPAVASIGAHKDSYVSLHDLTDDPVVQWQHRLYPVFAVLLTYGLPAVLCRSVTEAFILGSAARVLSVHSALAINSLSTWPDWFGDHSYSRDYQARDHVLNAVITWGEGYQNGTVSVAHDVSIHRVPVLQLPLPVSWCPLIYLRPPRVPE